MNTIPSTVPITLSRFLPSRIHSLPPQSFVSGRAVQCPYRHTFPESRHHIGQHEIGNAQCHDQQRHRVEHGGFDAGLNFRLLFEDLHKLVDKFVERAGNLTGLDHIEIDIVEMARMALERLDSDLPSFKSLIMSLATRFILAFLVWLATIIRPSRIGRPARIMVAVFLVNIKISLDGMEPNGPQVI